MAERATALPDAPTGFIKARDVRFQLQGKHVDPAVMHILEALAEQASHQERKMAELAQIIEQMSDIISNFVRVAENMKSEINKMKQLDPHPELGPVSTN